MHRASNAFSVLQATAGIVAAAIILWSLGLPSLRFAEAANVTSFSDTLTDTAPSVAANHTIEFVTPSGVAALQSIVITFPSGSFDLSTIGEEDVDLLENGNPEAIGGGWTVATTSNTITIQSAGIATIAAGATTTVLVGLHATNDGSPDSQIINPVAGSYEIDVVAGASDTGSTRVAIIDNVTVTASVDTVFTFTVSGVAGGQTVNTADSTGGTTTATTIPFGVLEADTASTAAQDLSVVTNASNGFVVTVVTDQQLNSTTGADIDGFRNGDYDETPVAWEAPSAVVGSEWTYGHWGVTSEDDTLTAGLTNPFNVGSGGDRFVSASTTPVEVFRHDGPTDGTTSGVGVARVGYKVEVSALQEAADDYTATLTYVATPVF
ncbi:hypothetical protein KC906_01520 [Candidatus Kaiserbacteria bacterium]|nr:hypothetical protein [Candidatus Kaiserbacteria bacterium]